MASLRIPDSLSADLQERVQARFAPWPLIQDWDMTFPMMAPGKATVKLRPNKHTLNGPRGNVNGGVLATMADMACALALCTIFDGLMPFATQDLHIRYLEPAKGDVLAEAEVVRLSKRGAVMECRLTCGDHLVAHCTAHFSIKPNLPG